MSLTEQNILEYLDSKNTNILSNKDKAILLYTALISGIKVEGKKNYDYLIRETILPQLAFSHDYIVVGYYKKTKEGLDYKKIEAKAGKQEFTKRDLREFSKNFSTEKSCFALGTVSQNIAKMFALEVDYLRDKNNQHFKSVHQCITDSKSLAKSMHIDQDKVKDYMEIFDNLTEIHNSVLLGIDSDKILDSIDNNSFETDTLDM